MLVVRYVLLAALVIYGAARASRLIDNLDRRTRLSGALLGTLLLALTTSLPELITSLTSTVALDNPSLAAGNLLGSNLFNLVLLAGVDFAFFHKRLWNRTDKGLAQAGILIAMHMVVLLPMILPWIGVLRVEGFTLPFTYRVSALSLLLFALYLYTLPRVKDYQKTVELDSPSGVGFLWLRFAAFSMLVIVASYFLTHTVDTLAGTLDVESSFVGAIFLGAATSLPELTVLFTLIRLNNPGVAVASILGSNLFNLFVIPIVDLAAPREDFFVALLQGEEAKNLPALLILSLVNSIMVLVALKRRPVKNRLLYAVPGLIILMSMVTYLAVSLLGG